MTMDNQIIIKNFNIRLFRQLLDQTLMVDNQVMVYFTQDIVRSCALTSTQSFMKMWTVPMTSLVSDNQSEVVDLDVENFDGPTTPTFDPFNIYVLKGDVFRRYLRVYGENPVTLKIVVDPKTSNGITLTIIGETQAGSSLTSTFVLTSDEFITSKVNDLDAVIDSLTPSEKDVNFILSSDEMKEVKTLIKELHKSNPNNTSFINFKMNPTDKTIAVGDAVFNVKFPLVKTENYNIPSDMIDFNILKSDFIVSGGHTYTFHTTNDKDYAIMLTAFSFGVIGCIVKKAYAKNDIGLEQNNDTGIDDVFGNDVPDVDDFIESF